MTSHDPNWSPGDPVFSPVSKMITLDPSALGVADVYKLLIGSVVPRPIALVSTVNEQGIVNLAPFSFFNAVCSHPPTLLFCVTRKPDGSKKDTLLNIENNRQFVVNTVSEWMAEPMNHCSAEYPHGVSEMEKAGFTPLVSTRVRPPRVKQSPVQLECELDRLIEIGEGKVGSATIVIGRIFTIHVHEPAYENGKIKIEELQPLSRLGGLNYGTTREVFSLPRPKPVL